MSTDESDKRNLSLYQIEVLLKTTAGQDLSKSNKSWLTLSDTKQLFIALDYDADSVYLPNMGREFNIKYKGDKVWLSPADGRSFTPCGWFTPHTLRKEVSESVYV